MTSNVRFSCTYSAIINSETEVLPDQVPQIRGETARVEGSFSPNFRIENYTSKTFKKVRGDKDVAKIGEMVYVQVNWSLPSLYQKLSFYVDECVLNFSGKWSAYELPIIKNNCYAKAIDAKAENRNKGPQKRSSKFSYRSFSIHRKSIRNVQTLRCRMRICLVDNPCPYNPIASMCPNDVGFKFTI